MTKLLEKALAEVSKLPAAKQDSLAALLLEELSSERRWEESFAKSQNQLAALAGEALGEFRRGETKPFETDRDLAHD